MTALRSRLPRKLPALAAMLLAVSVLSGCNALQRLSEVGEPPKMSAIDNPATQRGYRPVSLPMPAPEIAERNPNSLWRAGARAFFRDQRAKRVGDIVTIIVNIDDQAELSNTTSRTRANDDDVNVDTIFGLETEAARILPGAVNPAQLLDLDSASTFTGNGNLDREEEITLRLAALVMQILPNGNMVVHGRQEVRVNSEMREVQVAGVLRPEDINSDNTISSDKIAEARISYGGRGTISDAQTPRYGTEVLDILLPF